VPVNVVNPIDIMAIAPMGSGFMMIPNMVNMKIANKCHDWLLSDSGTGLNQSTRPTMTGIRKFLFGMLANNVVERSHLIGRLK